MWYILSPNSQLPVVPVGPPIKEKSEGAEKHFNGNILVLYGHFVRVYNRAIFPI